MSRNGSSEPGRKWPRYMLRSRRRRRRPAVLTASALRGVWPGRRAMTIVVHQRPMEETRTANKSCKWLGEAIVNGRTYTATSRVAPANDIARQLVADGMPDA